MTHYTKRTINKGSSPPLFLILSTTLFNHQKRKVMTFFTKAKATLFLLMLYSGNVLSHGLTMTTAQVTQRHNNHITIRVETELTELFKKMTWQKKPASLLHLANGSDVVLSGFRLELARLFSEKMLISFAGKAIESANLRLASADKIKQQLLLEVANNVLNKVALKNSLSHSHNDHGNSNNGRQNYLVVKVDGFIPTEINQQAIEILFPTELGNIMVSYNKPQVQTLTVGKQSSRYLQKID